MSKSFQLSDILCCHCFIQFFPKKIKADLNLETEQALPEPSLGKFGCIGIIVCWEVQWSWSFSLHTKGITIFAKMAWYLKESITLVTWSRIIRHKAKIKLKNFFFFFFLKSHARHIADLWVQNVPNGWIVLSHFCVLHHILTLSLSVVCH